MSDSVEMHVFLDFIILESGLPRSHPRHFSKLIFFQKYEILQHKSVCTKKAEN